MFDPKNPDSTRKKVTNSECWTRFGVMITPIVGPYVFIDGKASMVLGGIWLAAMGPLFCTPIADDDDWEEGTEWFQGICKNIGLLYIGLIIFAGFLGVFGNGGWR